MSTLKSIKDSNFLERLACDNWYKEYQENLRLSNGDVDIAIKHLIRDMLRHIRK